MCVPPTPHPAHTRWKQWRGPDEERLQQWVTSAERMGIL